MRVDFWNNAKRREEDLLEALAWMAVQYLERTDIPEGHLYHSFMSAGELACRVLADHGLIDWDASGGIWTDKGKDFLANH